MNRTRKPWLTALRRTVLVTSVLAVAALLADSSLGGSAVHAATARTAGSAGSDAKPTIVLVHGAWADSGSWNAVISRLQRAGYTVYAPPNPLQGLANDTGTLAGFLHTISGPVVLVGHSYGGMVITNAAAGDPQVKALVYDDAYIPAKDETLEGLTTKGSCFAVSDLSSVFSFVPFPGAPSGVFDAYVKQSVFPGCFANGLPVGEAAVLAATQRPLVTTTFADPSGDPAWATIPSWAIIGTADHIVTPAEQLFMAQRAHAHITEIDAPHLSMISDPAAVAGVIIQAARSAR